MTPAEAREELLNEAPFDILHAALQSLEDYRERLAPQHRLDGKGHDDEARELAFVAEWFVSEGLTRMKALAMGPLASRMSNRLRDDEEDLAA